MERHRASASSRDDADDTAGWRHRFRRVVSPTASVFRDAAALAGASSA